MSFVVQRYILCLLSTGGGRPQPRVGVQVSSHLVTHCLLSRKTTHVGAFMPAWLCSSSQHQFYDMRQLLCNMYNNSLIIKYVERQDVLVKLLPVLQNGLIYERSFIYDVVCSVEKSS